MQHGIGKVALFAAGWAAIGGTIAISLGASLVCTIVIAFFSALLAGYTYGPKEVNIAIAEWRNDNAEEIRERFWAGCGFMVVAISAYGCILPLVLLIPTESDNVLQRWEGRYIVIPVMFLMVIVAVIWAVGGIFFFLGISNIEPWWMPVSRTTFVKLDKMMTLLSSKHPLTTRNLFFLLLSLPIISVLASVIIVVMLAIDLCLTLTMLPSKDARLGTMIGAFTGTMAAAFGNYHGLFSPTAVTLGALIGGLVGAGGYALRLQLTPTTTALTVQSRA